MSSDAPPGRMQAAPDDGPRLRRTLASTYAQTATIVLLGAVLGLGVVAVLLATGNDPLASALSWFAVFGLAVLVAVVRAGAVVARGQPRSGTVYVLAALLIATSMATLDNSRLLPLVALLVPVLAAAVGRWSVATGRRVLPLLSGLGVLVLLLSVDGWWGEREEVRRAAGELQESGVVVWVPTGEDDSCEPRYLSSRGAGMIRYSWWCDTGSPEHVEVMVTRDVTSSASATPSVVRRQEGSSGFSMVATAARPGAVVAVRRVGVSDLGRAERLAASLAPASPSWVTTRGLPLHELALQLGVWGDGRRPS